MIIFDDNCKIGIRAIDTQHNDLVNLYNKLESLMKREFVNLSEPINDLFKYTIDHFRTEEQFMEIIKYPEINNHKKHHKDFLNFFDELSIRLLNNEANKFELLSMLGKFIEKHILSEDIEFGKYYLDIKKNNGSGI